MIEFEILIPKGIRIGFLDSAYPPSPPWKGYADLETGGETDWTEFEAL